MRYFLVSLVVVSSALGASHLFAEDRSGKELYQHYCSSCHPDGGNIIRPDKDLRRLTREADGLRTAEDVVKRMRKPAGPQMPRYDRSLISDTDAKKIGEYIISTFK